MISASPVPPINTQSPEVRSENDTVLNGLNFIVPPPPSLLLISPLLLSLRGFISQKCEHIFLLMGWKKEWETIKNMKSPSSQNIRHRKTTLSYDWIYQNWQVKVDCCVSIDWAIFQWKPRGCLHNEPNPATKHWLQNPLYWPENRK